MDGLDSIGPTANGRIPQITPSLEKTAYFYKDSEALNNPDALESWDELMRDHQGKWWRKWNESWEREYDTEGHLERQHLAAIASQHQSQCLNQ